MIKNKKFKIRYLTDNQGKKKDVVLSLKDFEELLEDIEDLAVLAERKRERTISHANVLRKLKSNGLI